MKKRLNLKKQKAHASETLDKILSLPTMGFEMTGGYPIPAEIKRFILTSIDSVPHLEALLLLRNEPKVEWDAKMMSQRLYVNEKKAADLLNDLCAGGFASSQQEEPPETKFYSFHPASLGLNALIDQLADIYTKNIVEVTKLIHSKLDKQAQQWGDAFKWQKEKE